MIVEGVSLQRLQRRHPTGLTEERSPVTTSGQSFSAPDQTRLGTRVRRAAGMVLGRPRPMVDSRIEEYALAHTTPESPLLAQVAENTARFTAQSFMMSGATQGQFLASLVHLGQARNILEIGTFTGYSALAMAEAMPSGGHITTCEVDPATARVAALHFAASPHAENIDLRVGPALPTIQELTGPFDLVFIDADKAGYLAYFDAVLPKLSEHGLIVADNTLHGGLDPQDDSDHELMEAVDAFNAAIHRDSRVQQVVLTVRDGLSLIRRA